MALELTYTSAPSAAVALRRGRLIVLVSATNTAGTPVTVDSGSVWGRIKWDYLKARPRPLDATITLPETTVPAFGSATLRLQCDLADTGAADEAGIMLASGLGNLRIAVDELRIADGEFLPGAGPASGSGGIAITHDFA